MAISYTNLSKWLQMGASALAQAIKNKEISVSELVELFIQRIEEVNLDLNAVVYRRYKEARKEAQEADLLLSKANLPDGALFGVPITIKDQYLVENTPTSLGLKHRMGKKLKGEGGVVQELRRQGAIILAKTSIPQLLTSWECDHNELGPAKNPYNLERTPGGSSGGEAALIAAMASPLGLGGDMGGSLRVPALNCGICSFKPSPHFYPHDDTPMNHKGELFFGNLAGFSPVESEPGPMANSVADLEFFMNALNSVAKKSGDQHPVTQLTHIGYYTDNGLFPVSPPIAEAIEESVEYLKTQGFQMVCLNSTLAENRLLEKALSLYNSLLSADKGQWITQALKGEKPIPAIKAFRQSASMPLGLRWVLKALMRVLGFKKIYKLLQLHPGLGKTRDYWRGIADLQSLKMDFEEFMNREGIDYILAPAVATPAPVHGSLASGLGILSVSYALVYNILGLPAGALPWSKIKVKIPDIRAKSKDPLDKIAQKCERNAQGLPIGFQVIGRENSDFNVLKLMKLLEKGSKRTLMSKSNASQTL